MPLIKVDDIPDPEGDVKAYLRSYGSGMKLATSARDGSAGLTLTVLFFFSGEVHNSGTGLYASHPTATGVLHSSFQTLQMPAYWHQSIKLLRQCCVTRQTATSSSRLTKLCYSSCSRGCPYFSVGPS